ncbi:peptidase family M1-domain-containing protein [Vararia minispora EC-137]|uniref:Peptidase family M1-domain-containing protein n=1 Tax=Vararia minispora EC-137 TaxID=1314806 RepID=A0ACB8QCM0_9AGAM|nr:peptidase family M1-domain-containing protein [Vararia minispora EC-137]
MSAPVKTADAYRLPTNVKPTHYDVTIRTDLEKEAFEGIVKIQIEVKEATATITLNAAAELQLSPATLYVSSSSQPITLSQASFDAGTQRVAYALPEELPANTKAELHVGFVGKLTDSMVGYYKSSSPGGIYALTQFEPTDARRAIPCWDEPLLKATFAVTMISRKGTISLCNTAAVEEVPKPDALTEALYAGIKEGEWVATRFATTPPMSTYLLAFANGNFEYLESNYVSPLSGKTRPLRIYATKDLIGQAKFCLEVTERAVPVYEKVFDVEFPLSKLDTLVAHDFDAGAMENWGLITGRTSAMLVDPNSLDLQRKMRVAGTQSHEIAHMWFGDITTMAWWDNLYLNEGFATVMGESIILNKLFPEWRVNSQFINDNLNQALRLDAKLSSHPIEVDVPDANQINQIFDTLSYAKAASVLRMLSEYVGEDKFLKGVSIYLKKHLFANSVSRNLWEGVAEATGRDIPKLMDPWVSKMGFPVLSVKETTDSIVVRQDRFLEDGPAKPEDNETIWTVPLSILSYKDDKPLRDNSAVLDTREATFKIDTSKPFKLNAETTGVYRVLYEPERLAAIANEAAKPDSIFSLNDRIGLVHDAMALAKSGHLKISAALTLVDALRDDEENLVWEGISDNLGIVRGTWWENQSVVDGLDAFRRALFGPLVRRLGFEYSGSDSAATTQLRTIAIKQAASAKDEEVVKVLLDRFKKFAAGDEKILSGDLYTTACVTAVKHGGQEGYDAVYKIFESRHPVASLHIASIVGLGAAKDSKLLDRTFDAALNKARAQDVLYFFSGLSQNIDARRPLRDFFEKNYDTLYDKFATTFTTKYLVSMTYSGFSSQTDLEHADRFFEGKDISKYNMSLAQAQDSVRSKIRWIERSTDDITQWLEQWQKTGTKL